MIPGDRRPGGDAAVRLNWQRDGKRKNLVWSSVMDKASIKLHSSFTSTFQAFAHIRRK